MADDAPVLGTTFVEIQGDTSKLVPALDAAENKAKGAGRVIENNLGGAYKSVQEAAKRLEKAVIEGNPRMQYGVQRYSAALNNLEKQIKATTAAGGTLTGDQVRDYAHLKEKLEQLTPAVENQMRVMRASRSEVQAGVGAWTNWEATIARVLTDLGFKGVGEKALIAGGIFAALEAGISVGEKLAHVLGTDKAAYEAFWKDVEHAGHETQSRLTNWVAEQLNGSPAKNFAIRMMMGPIGAFMPDAWKPAELGDRTLVQGRKDSAGKLATPQQVNEWSHFAEIEKRALEFEKERADLMNNTAASDKYARMLKDLELREEGYTDALMKDGDALRKLMLDRDQEMRQMERKKKADEEEQKRLDKIETTFADAFGRIRKTNKGLFDGMPLPTVERPDTFNEESAKIAKRMLASTRSRYSTELELRKELARDEAQVDLDRYAKELKEGKLNQDRYNSLVRDRRKELYGELISLDERYANDFVHILSRIEKSYGTTGQNIETLTRGVVSSVESSWENSVFNSITGNIRGVKDAFKQMLNDVLREIINFMVRREVQQFLSLAMDWYSAHYGLPSSSPAAGISVTPGSVGRGLVSQSVSAPSGMSYGGGSGGSGGGGGKVQVVVSMEPGLIARIVQAGGEVGYQRVAGDFDINGPMRGLVRSA